MFTTLYAPPPIAPCVIALVVAAASTDLQCRRIPNILVAVGLVGALFTQCWLHEFPAGALAWLTGALVGLGLFLPLYLLRGMAAGDVKLLAMVGAWIGPPLVFYVALATCVIGGVWALALAARRGQVSKLFSATMFVLIHPTSRSVNPAPAESMGTMPYGVAIAAGTIAVLVGTAAQLEI
ncbi:MULTISPECIES: A24 family peptidase [Paraburkholderia]|uniref:Peptidase A24 n=1 Tax=Paraburkholderia podalyriae TaxID=1938811 RepID=A0ABR7PKX3_9BURK|nr:prepilin peptidase [Paraburkholderia podalyriae]MBC8746950.1 peptidase A24 [Paraburkholderia podalyriae]